MNASYSKNISAFNFKNDKNEWLFKKYIYLTKGYFIFNQIKFEKKIIQV